MSARTAKNTNARRRQDAARRRRNQAADESADRNRPAATEGAERAAQDGPDEAAGSRADARQADGPAAPPGPAEGQAQRGAGLSGYAEWLESAEMRQNAPECVYHAVRDRILVRLADGRAYDLDDLAGDADVVGFIPAAFAHREFRHGGDNLDKRCRAGAAGTDTPDGRRRLGCRLVAESMVRLLTSGGLVTLTRRNGRTSVEITGRPQDDRYVVDPEFAALVPPHTFGEQLALAADLVAWGRCYDPLIVWDAGDRKVLIDGHMRRRLAAAFRVTKPPALEIVKMADRETVKDYLRRHHLARRNVTALAASYLRGGIYIDRKQVRRGQRPAGAEANPQSGDRRTATLLARELAVGRGTIERDGAFAAALDQVSAVCGIGVRDDVLSRRLRWTRGDVVRLATLDGDRMQAVAAAAIDGRGRPQFPGAKAGGKVVALALPAGQPAAQAEVLVRRLGEIKARRLAEAVLERLAVGPSA